MTMHSDDVIGSQNTFSPLSLVTIYAAPAGVSSVNIWLSNLDRFTEQMQKQIFECAHSSDQALLDRRDKRLRAAAVLAPHAVTPCFVLCLFQKPKRVLANMAYAPEAHDESAQNGREKQCPPPFIFGRKSIFDKLKRIRSKMGAEQRKGEWCHLPAVGTARHRM